MKPEDYPIFSELYEFLPEYKKDIKSKEKEKIIEQLDILLSRFLTGTDSYLFDGYTTINLENDLIAFNLQELLYSGNQRLINTQTLNLLTYLNNSIVSNKILNDKVKVEDRKHVMIIADEFHLFIDENNFEVSVCCVCIVLLLFNLKIISCCNSISKRFCWKSINFKTCNSYI